MFAPELYAEFHAELDGVFIIPLLAIGGLEPAYPAFELIKFLAPDATSSLPVSKCDVLATSSGGESADSAVPGREFIGDPLTELGCVTGNWIAPDPELIVRCGGRRGAPDAVDAAASPKSKGAGEPRRGTFAPVDGRTPSAGVIARSGIGSWSLLTIVYVVMERSGAWCEKPSRLV